MALPGAKPKPQGTTRHRNPVAEWTEVEDVPFTDGPDLPGRESQFSVADAGREYGLGISWPESTTRWWSVVSRMPHAKLWSKADWEFAIATAEVHARTMEAWRGYTGTELRNREKVLGVFMDARRDLRIRYVEPKPATDNDLPAGVTSIASFRNL